MHDDEVAELPGERHRLRPDGDEPERRAAALEAVQVVQHRPLAGRAVVVEHVAVGPQLAQGREEVAQDRLGDHRQAEVFQCSEEPRPNDIAYLPSVIALSVEPMAAVMTGCRVWWLIAALAMPEGRRPAGDRARERARLLDREPLADHARAEAQPLGVGGLGEDLARVGRVVGDGVVGELVELVASRRARSHRRRVGVDRLELGVLARPSGPNSRPMPEDL